MASANVHAPGQDTRLSGSTKCWNGFSIALNASKLVDDSQILQNQCNLLGEVHSGGILGQKPH